MAKTNIDPIGFVWLAARTLDKQRESKHDNTKIHAVALDGSSPIQSTRGGVIMSTNDAVDLLEQFLGNDDGELSWQVCEAIGEVLERLRAAEVDAGRYRWLIEQGDSTQWMNILKADPDDFFSLEECITTLME